MFIGKTIAGLTKRAPDAGDAERQCALAGRCSLEARSPDLRTFQAVSYALSFFWLDGFAVPAPAQVTQSVSPPLLKHFFLLTHEQEISGIIFLDNSSFFTSIRK